MPVGGRLLVALLLVAYVAAQGASSSLPDATSPSSALSSSPTSPPSPTPAAVPLHVPPQPSSPAPPSIKKLLQDLLGNLPIEVPIPPWWRSNSTPMDDLPPASAYDPPMAPPTRSPKPTLPVAGSSEGGVTSMVGDGVLAIINNLENTTASRMCSRLLLDYQRYERLLCSDEVVEAFIKGGSSSLSYYDLSRCSPTNYDLGCLSGFFSPDPPEEGEQRRFLNAFYPAVQCCPGHYCPVGLVCMIPCSAGAYCPPVITANNGTSCEPYGTVAKPYLGCGGAETNFACPAGYYCPNTSTTIQCPSNRYCPSGSRRPQRCPPLAACPRGASAPNLDLGGLAEVLAVLALLFGIIFLSRRQSDRKWEKAQSARQISKQTKAVNRDKDEAEADGQIEEQSLLLPSTDARCRVDIHLDNLGVQLADGRWLLRGVNGQLSAGHVTAILGPSGAGKSVLLHTLAGRTGSNTITGGIVINGLHDQSLLAQTECRQLVGFVPQEDIMHRSLTVFENVDFNAQWRLPRSMHLRQKMDAVFGVLEVLGLDNPRVMRTLIGDDSERGVSGGERKRVNIGMELVAQPSLLLLDEPTSGLDASTSIDVVRALKTVASSGGVNVVVVLHQPRAEILRLFDDLLLLAPGGRTVYAGPTSNALSYFNNLGYTLPAQCNPADFFLDIISGSVPREGLASETIDKEVHLNHLVEQWENYRSAELVKGADYGLPSPHDDIPAVMKRRKTAGVLKQTWLCTKRAVVQRTRELNTALTDYCLVAIAGLVLGLLFHAVELDKVPNVNLFISMALGFAATQQSLRLFGSERTVFEREAFTGIDRTAYFLGKNLSSLADLFILPFVFLSLFYSFSNPRGSFGDYLLLLVAAQFALSGLGHLISVVLDPAKAQLAAVVATLMLCGISGFSPLKPDLGQFGVVCFGSYGFWLMEALFIVEADHYPDIFAQTKNDIAAMFDYDLNRSLGMHVGILVGMGLVGRLLCLLMLLVMHRGSKPSRCWSSTKRALRCRRSVLYL